MNSTRRDFIRSSGLGAVALAELDGLQLPCFAGAEERAVTSDIVQFTPDIEPVVRLIEKTPREKCFDMMAGQIRKGLPYRRLVAALYLAGIRNVNPHPLGFKFHCVLAMHSAHQLSLDAPVNDRLLPMFWMLENFKQSQARDAAEGDFKMPPVKGKLPAAVKAWKEFHMAMEAWDEERADLAITVLVRSRGALEVMEGLWRYGCRDYRNIGHKPIYVAGAWRVLQTIGWRHAEPILRSVARGMTDYGPTKRVDGYAFEDQCYLPNLEHIAKADQLPSGWTMGKENVSVTQELLDVVRSGDFHAASNKCIQHLSRGAGAICLWDAAHLGAAELMMRHQGIIGLHAVTSVNGLRYAFESSGASETRLLMLLQALGWVCQFGNLLSRRKDVIDVRITSIDSTNVARDEGEAIEEIFADVGANASRAAAKTIAFAGQHQVGNFVAHARQQILRKNRDVHGLKYPIAVFEDYRLVSPIWRPLMLATATYYLPGSSQGDSTVMTRAREAIRSI